MPAITNQLSHSKKGDKKTGIAHEAKEIYQHNSRLVRYFTLFSQLKFFFMH